MEAAEMRSLLKRMCKTATAKARALGFDIDFEKGLYIEACANIWRVFCCYDGPYVQLVNCHNGSLALGAKFMSYVPAIDRLADIPISILEKSLVGQLYVHKIHGFTAVLPLVDEFAYKFSDKSLEMVLQMFMQHGSFAMFQNPAEAEFKKMLIEQEKLLCMKSKALLAQEINMPQLEFKSKMKALFDEHERWRNNMKDKMWPISVALVPKPCKSLEELSIVLDCYDVE